MRFDGKRYVDCKWCGGRGCNFCEAEADKAYKAAFPEGPKPIATFSTSELGEAGVVELLSKLMGPQAMEAAQVEAEKQAGEFLAANPSIAQMASVPEEQLKPALASSLVQDILTDNIIKAAANQSK